MILSAYEYQCFKQIITDMSVLGHFPRGYQSVLVCEIKYKNVLFGCSQSCQAPPPVWRLLIPGASMLLWNGPHPQTKETQTSRATPSRSLTKRPEYVHFSLLLAVCVQGHYKVVLLIVNASSCCVHRTGSLSWIITIDWMPPSLTSSWATPTHSECILKTSVELARRLQLRRRNPQSWRLVSSSFIVHPSHLLRSYVFSLVGLLVIKLDDVV